MEGTGAGDLSEFVTEDPDSRTVAEIMAESLNMLASQLKSYEGNKSFSDLDRKAITDLAEDAQTIKKIIEDGFNDTGLLKILIQNILDRLPSLNDTVNEQLQKVLSSLRTQTETITKTISTGFNVKEQARSIKRAQADLAVALQTEIASRQQLQAAITALEALPDGPEKTERINALYKSHEDLQRMTRLALVSVVKKIQH
jgi:hypothetical protein